MSPTVLQLVQTQITLYGMTPILILGTIGNAIVIILFNKNRKNPCSMYLMNAAIMNIVYITFSVILYLYAIDYGDPTANSLIFCKLRYYLGHVWGQVPRYFIAAACIDRFALTSTHVRLRAFSQPSIARFVMIIITVFMHIVPIHIAIMTTIENGRCGQFGLYFPFYTAYTVIFLGSLPPVTMAVFGYLAYRNVRRIHMLVCPVGGARINRGGHEKVHRRDRELLTILLAEAAVYVVTMGFYPCLLLEIAITSYTNSNKSPLTIQIESFLLYMAIFLFIMNDAAPFYIYCVASSAFRRDFKQLVVKCWCGRTGRQQNMETTMATTRQIQLQVETGV